MYLQDTVVVLGRDLFWLHFVGQFDFSGKGFFAPLLDQVAACGPLELDLDGDRVLGRAKVDVLFLGTWKVCEDYYLVWIFHHVHGQIFVSCLGHGNVFHHVSKNPLKDLSGLC